MTTNSTNNYSRQETLHNAYSQSSGNSTLNSDNNAARLPPRTRPVVALPPSKLEPVLDVDSSAVYEDAYCELGENKILKNPRLTGSNQSERSRTCDHDSLAATRAHEIPGNRPPMWRQRVQENSSDSHCNSCGKGGSGDSNRHSKDRSKGAGPRQASESTSDARLLPSKLSFKSSRHHRSDSHCTSHSRSSRNVHNSLDNGSTGSSRPYESKCTNSTDYNEYGESQYSDYPDASQMNPDDIFYPPGGSFQPYQAKYEPGCYKSLSGCHRPKHPPSPPVRDEPLKPEFLSRSKMEDHKTPGLEEERSYHRSQNALFTHRSSSMQNLSQIEEQEKSGIRRRLARSASAHRKHESEERRLFSRSNSSLQHSQGYSGTSSFGFDNTGSYIADYPKIRGRSDTRRSNPTEPTDSLCYKSNHNLSKPNQDPLVHRQTSNCSSAGGGNSSNHDRHRLRKHHSSSSDIRTRTKDTDGPSNSSNHRQVNRFSL